MKNVSPAVHDESHQEPIIDSLEVPSNGKNAAGAVTMKKKGVLMLLPCASHASSSLRTVCCDKAWYFAACKSGEKEVVADKGTHDCSQYFYGNLRSNDCMVLQIPFAFEMLGLPDKSAQV